MRAQRRTAPTTTTTKRPPLRGPGTGPRTVSAPAMTEERRRMLGISNSPGRNLAIGLAFWGAFGALVLAYLGAIG